MDNENKQQYEPMTKPAWIPTVGLASLQYTGGKENLEAIQDFLGSEWEHLSGGVDWESQQNIGTFPKSATLVFKLKDLPATLCNKEHRIILLCPHDWLIDFLGNKMALTGREAGDLLNEDEVDNVLSELEIPQARAA